MRGQLSEDLSGEVEKQQINFVAVGIWLLWNLDHNCTSVGRLLADTCHYRCRLPLGCTLHTCTRDIQLVNVLFNILRSERQTLSSLAAVSDPSSVTRARYLTIHLTTLTPAAACCSVARLRWQKNASIIHWLFKCCLSKGTIDTIAIQQLQSMQYNALIISAQR